MTYTPIRKPKKTYSQVGQPKMIEGEIGTLDVRREPGPATLGSGLNPRGPDQGVVRFLTRKREKRKGDKRKKRGQRRRNVK